MPSETPAQRLILAGGSGAARCAPTAGVQAEQGLGDEETLQRLSPAGAIYFLMDEADVERIMCHPLGRVGSDSLPDRATFEQSVQASEVLSRNTRPGRHE